MSACDDCDDSIECLMEGWEPCKKSIAWEKLESEDMNPDYKPTGTTTTWHDQKKKDKETGTIRKCNPYVSKNKDD